MNLPIGTVNFNQVNGKITFMGISWWGKISVGVSEILFSLGLCAVIEQKLCGHLGRRGRK